MEQLVRTHARVFGLRLYVEHYNITAQCVYDQIGMIVTGYMVYASSH